MNLKPKTVIIAIAALVVLVVILERACPRDGKYIKLKTTYETAKAAASVEKEEAARLLSAKEGEITLKDEEIDNLKLDIIAIDEERDKLALTGENKARKIEELKKERGVLEGTDAIIANQDILIKTWEERFWNERQDKEKVIEQRNYWSYTYFKEHDKYLIEKGIRKSTERQLTNLENLIKLGDSVIVEGEKRSSGLSFKFTLQSVLYTAAGFGFGYLLGAVK